jgi:hypothetical protein
MIGVAAMVKSIGTRAVMVRFIKNDDLVMASGGGLLARLQPPSELPSPGALWVDARHPRVAPCACLSIRLHCPHLSASTVCPSACTGHSPLRRPGDFWSDRMCDGPGCRTKPNQRGAPPTAEMALLKLFFASSFLAGLSCLEQEGERTS